MRRHTDVEVDRRSPAGGAKLLPILEHLTDRHLVLGPVSWRRERVLDLVDLALVHVPFDIAPGKVCVHR
jgi:hypothetical protein